MADKTEEKTGENGFSSGSSGHEQTEHVKTEAPRKRGGIYDVDATQRSNLNAVFENPLEGIPKEQLFEDVEEFCRKFDLMDHIDVFKKGALVSQNPSNIHNIVELDDADRAALEREHTHKWSQPWQLYWLVGMCSMAAVVQGMDETVNNGAQTFYMQRFNVTADRFPGNQVELIQGLIVGAPYLACAVLGCWLTEPLNYFLARRGTIFWSCAIAAVASIWEGVANSWVNLFIARFVLGLGIGSKSTTVPVYSAECAPAPIRGALVMQWQVWTAFGIMLGNIMGVAFSTQQLIDEDLGWRLMLGSTVVAPIIVMAQVYFCPESPRWLLQHDRVADAFKSFRVLRPTDIQAARDLYYAHVGVELEKKINKGRNFFTMFLELFTVPRNRRATFATWIVMFMQQFVGVNVIAYYSTNIFLNANYSLDSALLASMGTGVLNFVFALPAFFTIDTWGRRNLLLFTFPFLSIFLLWTGFSFFINPDTHPTARVAMVTTGMYLFEVFYSPGEGPVPFTYSAEAFPLHVRDVGMSWATATTWCFNFILAFTWPLLETAFKDQGAFGWYAAWTMIGWVLVLLFMPETKALTLEELDQVFSVPTWKHASYQLKNSWWHVQYYVLWRKDLVPLEPFYKGAEKLADTGMNAGLESRRNSMKETSGEAGFA